MQARNSFVVLTSVRCLTSPEECPRSVRSKRDVLAEGTCSMILTFACHRLTVYILQYRIDIFWKFEFPLSSFAVPIPATVSDWITAVYLGRVVQKAISANTELNI